MSGEDSSEGNNNVGIIVGIVVGLVVVVCSMRPFNTQIQRIPNDIFKFKLFINKD